MHVEVKKSFPANLDYLHEMLDLIRKESKKRTFSEDVTAKIVLAVEEAIVNVIKHGYSGQEGHIEIICKNPITQPGIEVLIKDQGVPFDPFSNSAELELKQQQILNAVSVDQVSIGGYGIYIYVGVMDQVEYQHLNGQNNLSLIKYLT